MRVLRTGRFVNLLVVKCGWRFLHALTNTVRSVARYCSAPKAIHRKEALGILAYINGTTWFSNTNQRGTLVDIY